VRSLALRGLVVASLLSAPAVAHAQNDFEAFRRREAEQMRSFMSREDSAFTSFLKREWKDFELSLANRPLARPKPTERPVAPPRPEPAGSPLPTGTAPTVSTVPSGNPSGAPRLGAPPAATVPVATSPVLPGGAVPTASALPSTSRQRPLPAPRVIGNAPANALNTMFYGALVSLPKVDLGLKPLPAALTTDAIADFWQQISTAQTKDLLAGLRRNRDLMSLGDWPYAQLVYRTSLNLADNDTTLARLIAWHLLVKSGYVARVGFRERTVHVLLKSNELVYGHSYFTIDGAKYYVVDLAGGLAPSVGSIRTYDRDHPDATKAIGFHMATLPFFAEELQQRTLRFQYRQQKYEIPVGVNRNLIEFLTWYPQTELPGYLNAEIESTAMDNLVAALRPHMTGRTELDAVNFLLRMVQTSFDYKTDRDQFNREKWFFPEETLFYPFSDCEDRSIMFAYLVRKLVPSVSVVGLIYADHIATAIRFSTAVPGDSRMFNGARYVVSDPTYIGADAGMEMPQYKTASPQIVEARAFGAR
jgi:hypothetical protein